MKEKKLFYPIIALAILVVFAVVLLVAVPKQNTEEETIKIGFIGPLSGNAAVFGLVEKNSAEIAVEEINNTGGIKGKKIEMIFEDGKCSEKEAVSAAQKLIGIDNVKIILAVCSAENLAIAPIAEKNKIIVISAWANNPAISDAGDFIFRMAVSDTLNGKITAGVASKKFNKIGIITELTDYPIGFKNAFSENFKKDGGEIIEEEFPQNSNDARTQISKILTDNVKAVLVNADSPTTTLMILKELKEKGFKGLLFGNVISSNQQIVSSNLAEGLIFTADPTIKENPIKKEFLEKYFQKFHESPAFEYPAVSRYASVFVIKQAIEQAGFNNEKIKGYLYTAKFKGALGEFEFDSKGDIKGIQPSVKQIKNSKIISYEESS